MFKLFSLLYYIFLLNSFQFKHLTKYNKTRQVILEQYNFVEPLLKMIDSIYANNSHQCRSVDVRMLP